jgi:hypothetical protein
MLILGQKSYLFRPTIFKVPQPNWYSLNIDFRCSNGTQEEKEDPDIKCRPTLVNGNMTRLGRVCFGRGHCDCGECVCDSPRPGVIITGKFCQTVKKPLESNNNFMKKNRRFGIQESVFDLMKTNLFYVYNL